MEPVIALVGQPNVGKSTLFNRLTRTRDALVADYPGLTRDRQYGRGRIGPHPYIVVDTGGIAGAPDGVEVGMQEQAMRAVQEADIILFLVDARVGLSVADQQLADILRRLGKPIYLVVNKIDGTQTELAVADFYQLGLGDPWPIAATTGRGVKSLMDVVLAPYAEARAKAEAEAGEEADEDDGRIKVAVVGRPNVGKSTLVNRLLGEERVLVYDMPGTTRDSIYIPFDRGDERYTLIDTAGVRRRSQVREVIEKFSVINTLQAIEAANVVILVVDAREGITEQDATLAGHVIEAGRAMVLAVNKWDGLDEAQKELVRRQLEVKMAFLDFARTHMISALHGSNVGLLLDSVRKAYDAAVRKLPTPMLNEVLQDALAAHSPPTVRGRRIKLRYAHQGGQNPPIIVIHGNQTEHVPDAYRRYLINVFRREFDLFGTPIRIEFRTGENPFEGRKNVLTPRQIARRRRLMRYVRKKG